MNDDYLRRLATRLDDIPVGRRDSVLAEELRRRDTLKERTGPGERRVLVVGGAGYIGSVLVSDLLAEGYSVVSVDCLLYENAVVAMAPWYHSRYDFHRIDLRDDGAVTSLLKDVSDVVILAALVGDPITRRYPRQSQQINVEALARLFEQLDRHGINKVLFVSTCSNYGRQKDDTPAPEDAELNPLSIYARNKVEIERLLQSRSWSFSYTILRFATAFGLSPRMRFDLTVSEFTRELYLGNELLVYDPDTWRPYCHVRDLSRAMRRVLDYPLALVSGRVFNTGGDLNNHTKRSIVETITRHVPRAKVTYREQGSDPRNYRVDFRRIRETLDFEPNYSIDDGVRELLIALKRGVFDDVAERPNFYGNRTIAVFEQQAQ